MAEKILDAIRKHWLLVGMIILALLGVKGLALLALVMYILA